MLAASRAHLDRAREYEGQDQLEAALGEYKLASEDDPSNRLISVKVADLDKTIRDRVEAARPKPQIEQLRARARASSQPPPLLNFTTPLRRVSFNNTSLRDILNFIASSTGINVTFDRQYTDRAFTVQLDGVTLEQALNQILSVNQLSYKVLSEQSILVFDDNAQKHAQYDEQVIQTFYLSNSDPTEMAQLLSTVLRPPGVAVQPQIVANKTGNSITIRATAPMVQIFEKIIQQNDKPRAEIVVDIEIMEVNRQRVKQYGLNLSEYALGGIFSPEVSPAGTASVTSGTTPAAGGGTTTTASASGRSTPPSGVTSPPPFNLNTISRGFTTADFYTAVPTAIVKFLESDTNTKLVAKPQLRGAEGTKLTLKVGDQIPIISTSYLPIAGGGAGVNPLSSYQYKDVGVNIDMTPRVTLEGDILLDVTIINNSRGSDVNIGGVNIPSFGNREVTTRLRLRDGESNLLAGLLREDERRSLNGFPGAIHVPVLKQLFSNNDEQIAQTDIIMLLTPRIVRAPDITEADLRPIYIGSQQSLGLGGPPPLIAQAPPADAAPGRAGGPGRRDADVAGPAVHRRRHAAGDDYRSARRVANSGDRRRAESAAGGPTAACAGPAGAAATGTGGTSRAGARGSAARPGARARRRAGRADAEPADQFARNRPGAGHHFAAADAAARGTGSLQHSDLDHGCPASIHRDADDGVRPGEAARAHGAGGKFPQGRRRQRHVLTAGRPRPHRHHDRARTRRHGRVGHGPAGRGAV